MAYTQCVCVHICFALYCAKYSKWPVHYDILPVWHHNAGRWWLVHYDSLPVWHHNAGRWWLVYYDPLPVWHHNTGRWWLVYYDPLPVWHHNTGGWWLVHYDSACVTSQCWEMVDNDDITYYKTKCNWLNYYNHLDRIFTTIGWNLLTSWILYSQQCK